MKWSIRVGRLFGIPLFIHVTFFLFLAWIGAMSWRHGNGMQDALENIVFICTLFGCVVLHELGHALTARRYGIPTRDITLLPIGGVARLDRMPDDPRQELWVALAGPAVNVVIAVALFFVHSVSSLSSLGDTGIESLVRGSFLSRVMAVNIFLVLFNMLPAFPMDGGRVLRALLATRLEYTRATHIAAVVGQSMALLFGLGGLLPGGNPMLLFIALFVWIGAAQESGMTQMRYSLAGIPVSRAMVTEFHTLKPGDTLADAVELTLKGTQRDFPVVDGEHVVGVLRQSDMLASLSRQGAQVRVTDVMHTDFEIVQASEMLDAAFHRLNARRCSTAPVAFQGRLVGLLTTDNVGEFLAIQGALGRPRRIV
ncbi:MAG TPA: site-2 protease family protein [Candidatus Krumholzibacteria bacterium]|nr:site-2 protease family protein [Candidatus Krumholzibacteria bacterium]